MAIFSGKIIEAYYTNADNSTVEVIYKEGAQAISYYMPVDFTNQDFKELIAEHDTDKIAESTIQRNRNYAKQLSDLVDAGIKVKTDLKQKVSVEDFVKKILNFDANDQESQEIFFTMKVEIFETKKLKDSRDKEYKSRLRSAKSPIELLLIYNELND